MDSFKKEISSNDYINDLFYSLRDNFKLLNEKTKLSEFKTLFKVHVIMNKIIVEDSKKLLSIIKLLKKNHILKPHYQYIKLMVNCFEEPNGKLIETKSLYGSKYILTLDEETKLKNLFHQLSS